MLSNALSLLPDPATADMLHISLDNVMERLWSADDQHRLERIVSGWQSCWDGVNYGRTVVDQYSAFCQTRQRFPVALFHNTVIR